MRGAWRVDQDVPNPQELGSELPASALPCLDLLPTVPVFPGSDLAGKKLTLSSPPPPVQSSQLLPGPSGPPPPLGGLQVTGPRTLPLPTHSA